MLDHFVMLNVSANVKILNRLRFIAIVGQLLIIFFSTYYLEILLPLDWLLGLIGIEACFQWYCVWRLTQKPPIKAFEILVHILFDSLMIAALVYFSGGPNNPFIYLLLLPIALAAQMLKLRDLMVVVCLQLLLYSVLNLYQRPLALGDSSPLASFHLHLMGMWVNFVLTVILISVFGFLTRYSMISKEKQLQRLRERQFRDEQILSLGIMSASAAHELGTPLATMAIIVEDLKHQILPENIDEDLDVICRQIKICRHIIQSLRDKSYHAKKQLTHQHNESMQPTLGNLKQQLQVVINNWLVYRPQVVSTQVWGEGFELLCGHLPISIEQALTNLLDNAADASIANGKDEIEISCYCNLLELIIEIKDFGKGVSKDLKQALGSSIHESQKQNRLGWGVFLSNASIERAGGRVQLLPADSGGTLTRINLFEGIFTTK